jgi:peptidoglycan hydrolase CwlO-like protein
MNYFKFLLILSFSFFVFSWSGWPQKESSGLLQKVFAEEIQSEITNKEQELEAVENKIEDYQKVIDLKKQQQATLSNQIDIIENEIKKAEEKIVRSDQEMGLVELEIKSLDLKIKEKDISLKYNKKLLSELIQSLYFKSQSNSLELLLKNDSLAGYFLELRNLDLISEKTKDLLTEVNRAKTELQKQKEDRSSKYEKLGRLKDESQMGKVRLEGQQDSKANLLEVTQGEEDKYQELLAKLESQKEMLLGDIEEMSNQNSSELAKVKAGQKKPKTGLASTSWYFSQRDPRWADSNIGLSRTKMGQYGCAVTSVSMVLRYHGVKIDPGILAKQRIFSYDLISWPNVWQGVDKDQKIGSSHGNLDWKVVDQEIEKGNPVIVFVGAKGRGGGHYVVIHHKDKKGKYVVHDPYWGANIFLDSTRDFVSAIYGSGTYMDQMIIYHGEGSSYLDVKDSADNPQKICEESGGTWSKNKDECTCPKSGYNKKNGACVKK